MKPLQLQGEIFHFYLQERRGVAAGTAKSVLESWVANFEKPGVQRYKFISFQVCFLFSFGKLRSFLLLLPQGC